MATVGYGNVSPHTLVGRIIVVIDAFWGSFLLSLFVVAVTQLFEISQIEKMINHEITMNRSATFAI